MPKSAVDEQRIDNKSYYDRFADNYEARRHGGYHLMLDDLQSELVLPAATGREALEVGCGTGLILRRVAEVAQRAVGIDLSPGMLVKARERGLDVQEASATSLPFDDASFDVTYSFKVLSHVPELDVALAEMARVTRPGGTVFAELYNKHSLRYLARLARGGHEIATGIDDNQVFYRFYRPDEVTARLPANLEVVGLHGVRVFTALPGMVAWPLIGAAICHGERALRSSPLARFGGFLVFECRRR